jgi:hypothetical protein
MNWIGIWVHACTVTLLAKLTQIWVYWGCWGEIMRCSNVVWDCKISLTYLLTYLPHTYCISRKYLSTYSYVVDRHMGAPLHCYTAGQVDPDWVIIWGWWGEIMTHSYVLGGRTPLTFCHKHIVYLEIVWAHSYAVDRHMGAPLQCYTAGQVDPDLSILGMVGSNKL